MSSKLILIIGPSGSGKGTMISLLKERSVKFFFPVSVTTRSPRSGEKNGENYFFISKEEFQDKINNNEFLEYACVHSDNYYGTLKEPILNALQNNQTVIREVDYQGFMSIKKLGEIPTSSLKSIFIMPPDTEVLKKRIQSRADISQDELEKRMSSIQKEILISKECDEILNLIDGDIEASYKLFKDTLQN